ncbi:MAG: hypothetical protein AAF211_00230 [Myxococcota bacterium]
MRPLAYCVLLISINPALAEEERTVVIWTPEDAEAGLVLRMSLDGLTAATGSNLELTWLPCSGGAPEIQTVASYDLEAGVAADFTTSMCDVEVDLGQTVVASGTLSGSAYSVELDDQVFTLASASGSVDADYTVLTGAITAPASLEIGIF